MKKLLLFSLFLPLLLLAGIKLDIDGRSAGMNLKAVACTAKMSYQHPAWAKSKGYLIFTRGANSAWGKYFITFVYIKNENHMDVKEFINRYQEAFGKNQ